MDRMAPGGGGRFARLKASLGRRQGVRNPGALAAYIGRKKYGKKRFAKMSVLARAKRKIGYAAHG